MKAGPLNAITDLKGLRVGNASCDKLKSGVTALICDKPLTASVAIHGGAPGTRDTELLLPENTVSGVDAFVLSGGSAFGLDAASGVQAWLRENNRGFSVGKVNVPIVPAAILFDLINGGDKDWGKFPWNALPGQRRIQQRRHQGAQQDYEWSPNKEGCEYVTKQGCE